ncbi:MAG: DegT/DnrJ/EryC1/StrS family aminotransferase, partial [Deltaproteobacteria bacterium]|nr:DegT/DnrJ/EryC1/StrS family aminotransferase [Deltaproteobacteria bacterium]
LQSAFKKLGYQDGGMPASDNTSQRIFSLPMHPYLKNHDIDNIIQAILQIA